MDIAHTQTDELVQVARRQLDAWTRAALDLVPSDPARVDAHCHIGVDSDGSTMSTEELLAQLDATGMHHAVCAPLHHPEGYALENERLREIAAMSGGRLHALHRCDPSRADVADDARQGLHAGAVGLKWHPRAERFGMHDPVALETAAVADEAGVAILIHAGRGMDRLGEGVVELARRHPNARFVLAHAAVSDLAWIIEATSDVPNVVFDTSWWRPTDVAALLATAPPGRVLHASDPPYGSSALGLHITVRLARACGWGDEAMLALMGGNARTCWNLDTAAAGTSWADHEPHMPTEEIAFRRAAELLATAIYVGFAGGEARETFDLACVALDVPTSHELHASAMRLQRAMRVGFTLLARGLRDPDDDISAGVHIASPIGRLGLELLMSTLVHLATPALSIRGIDHVS